MGIFSVIGSKNWGKTSTIEHLVRELSRIGFVLGPAKHMHDADASTDKEGKDATRFASADSKVVVGVSPR